MRVLTIVAMLATVVGCGAARVERAGPTGMHAPVEHVVAAVPAEPPRAEWSWTEPIELTAARNPLRTRRISQHADWASASPDGVHVVSGRTYYDGGVADGELGRATLHPEGQQLPVAAVDDSGVVFSPDGRHVLVLSEKKAWRPRAGARWQNPRPRLTVLAVPSLALVAEADGADARWSDATTIGFRRGTRAMRLDLRRAEPTAVGVVQRSFGCTAESFGPETPCASGKWSYLDAVDAGLNTWIVSDSCMERLSASGPSQLACTPHEAVRAVDLATGQSRTLASAQALDHHLFSRPSPGASRLCFWLDDGANSLSCARVDGGDSERVFSGGERGMLAWLSEDRVLVDREGETPVIVDLARHTLTRVLGLPPGAGWPVALAGGRRVVFTRSSTWLVDLEVRTFAAGPSNDGPYSVYPSPSIKGGFAVREARKGPLSLVEL